MKNTILTAILLIFNYQLSIMNCSGQSFQWAKSIGGNSNDWGMCVASDDNGNVLVGGAFSSPGVTFGSTALPNMSSGGESVFIAKYDANGNVLWAKSPSGAGDCLSIATDANGNVLVTGVFYNTFITFGTTMLINASAGNEDVFIAKYDPNGNVLWAKSIGGTADDRGNSITADYNGNILVTGNFRSHSITVGTTVLNHSTPGPNAFVAKYDENGNVIWANSIGSQLSIYCSALGEGISTDTEGNIGVAGWFDCGSLTIGSTVLSQPGAFIVKYDAYGGVLWAKSVNGSGYIQGNSVDFDISGNLLVAGVFQDTIVIGTTMFTPADIIEGYFGVFIAKYDPLYGNVLWAKAGPGVNNTGLPHPSICTDINANVWVAGAVSMKEYDTNGNFLRTVSLAGTFPQNNNQISTDASGNVMVTGSFLNSTLTLGTIVLSNLFSGTNNIYVAKLYSVTGIEETEQGNRMLLYPNPATDQLFIETNDTPITEVNIYNTTGSLVNQTKQPQSKSIDVSQLAIGVYVAEIKTKQGSVMRRWAKM